MKKAMPNFKLKQQFYELLTCTQGPTREVKKYLDEAKTWYNKLITQVEP